MEYMRSYRLSELGPRAGRASPDLSFPYTMCLSLSCPKLCVFQESYDRAKAILKSHAGEHRALAQALMKHETLDADEIKGILEGKKIPFKQRL